MYLEWDDKYSVAVEEFDDQHKRLFALINELHDAIKSGKKKEVLGTVLDELIEYTKTHFANEEAEMKALGYPEFHLHMEEHHALISQVDEYKTAYEAGKTMMITEVMGFLVNWLINHIAYTDKKYGPHFNEKGLS